MDLLVTIAEVKDQVEVDHDFSDAMLAEMAMSAQEAVIGYIDEAERFSFIDTSGDAVRDTSDTNDTSTGSLVPWRIKRAILIQTADYYRFRESEPVDPVPSEFGYGYLSRTVVAILYPMRTPVFA